MTTDTASLAGVGKSTSNTDGSWPNTSAATFSDMSKSTTSTGYATTIASKTWSFGLPLNPLGNGWPTRSPGHERFLLSTATLSLPERVAARHLYAGFFEIGDPILYGKYKNHHGVIRQFGKDKHGNPTIIIEPVPKGRKKDKEMGLFKIWHDPPPDKAEEEAKKMSSLALRVAAQYMQRPVEACACSEEVPGAEEVPAEAVEAVLASTDWVRVGGDLEARYDGVAYVDFRAGQEPLMFISREALAKAAGLFPDPGYSCPNCGLANNNPGSFYDAGFPCPGCGQGGVVSTLAARVAARASKAFKVVALYGEPGGRIADPITYLLDAKAGQASIIIEIERKDSERSDYSGAPGVAYAAGIDMNVQGQLPGVDAWYYLVPQHGGAFLPKDTRYHDARSALIMSLRAHGGREAHICAATREDNVYFSVKIASFFDNSDFIPKGTVESWWQKYLAKSKVQAPGPERRDDESWLGGRLAAKYKGKKKTDEGNTVYLYSDKQIEHRNRQKAKRVEKLRGKIGDLRTKVKKDLKSSDPEKKLTALAVALMDHTYERVGNDESAGDGHYGVTGWHKGHVSFGKGKAKLKYVGKSGVKHDKEVTDKGILAALKDAYEAVEGEEANLFEWEGGKVTAEKVNAYLKDFDVTAKDIRGFHANNEMQTRLKAERKKGGALPEDKKKREKQLKEEFKTALEETAEAVGHEAATLRSQYLVPGLEDTFMKDGTIIDKLGSSPPEGANTFEEDDWEDDWIVLGVTLTWVKHRPRGSSVEPVFCGHLDGFGGEAIRMVFLGGVQEHDRVLGRHRVERGQEDPYHQVLGDYPHSNTTIDLHEDHGFTLVRGGFLLENLAGLNLDFPGQGTEVHRVRVYVQVAYEMRAAEAPLTPCAKTLSHGSLFQLRVGSRALGSEGRISSTTDTCRRSFPSQTIINTCWGVNFAGN